MAAPDKISFSVEPQESGKLLYLQVAPTAAGQPRTSAIACRLVVTSTRADSVTLKEIRVSFPKSNVPEQKLTRDKLVIGAGKSKTVYFEAEETLKTPWPAPATIQLALVFKGFTDPITQVLALAPHKSPAPKGSYSFVGRPEDMKADEYFYFQQHGGGGDQHFGYDIGCLGWNEHHQKFLTYSDQTAKTNESHFAWHKRIHAMADGVVLKASAGNKNNPSPGQNLVVRTGDIEAGELTEVALAQLQRLEPNSALSSARMLAAVRTASGKLKLLVFEQTEDGKELTRLGAAEGVAMPEAAGAEVSVTVVNRNTAVSAVISKSLLFLTLWSISDDAKVLRVLDEKTISGVTSVKVVRLSGSSFATAARLFSGNLAVAAWQIGGNPLSTLSSDPMSQALAGKITSLDLAVLSGTRLATSVVTPAGQLKVIVWGLTLDEKKAVTAITRLSDTGDVEPVTAAALSVTSVANELAAAVRTTSGKLKIFFWSTGAEGKIQELARQEAEPVSRVSLSLFKKTTLMSAVRLSTGTLRVIVWKLNGQDTPKPFITRHGNGEAGAVDAMALARIDTEHTTAATAVRDGAGRLKIILWQLARSNGLVIRHGDPVRGFEVVSYFHFSEVSKDLLVPGAPVKEGQFLGLLGNSGASGGPHLHVHAVKAPEGLSLQELIAKVNDGTWTAAPHDAPYRPLPFHNARAMLGSSLKRGGVWKNSFGVMDGDGVYFGKYALFPGPASESPRCATIHAELKGLELEIKDLQAQLKEAGPGEKPSLAAQIKKLQQKRDVLKAKGSGIGCKI
jgi:hypothetical protein